MFDHVAPPSRLRSMRIVAPVPRLWLNVMAWVVLIGQVTAVFGAVRVSDGVPDTIVKLAAEVAKPDCPAPSRAVTRIRPCVVIGPGVAHVQLCAVPARPVQPATAVKL